MKTKLEAFMTTWKKAPIVVKIGMVLGLIIVVVIAVTAWKVALTLLLLAAVLMTIFAVVAETIGYFIEGEE